MINPLLRVSCTLLAVCAPAVQAASVSVLNNGSFESTVLPTAIRTSWNSSVYGQWAVGDPMARVGVTNGITPLDGTWMMDFAPTSGTSADVYQIVDLTAFAADIDTGQVTVTTRASFNSVSAAAVGMAMLAWRNAPTAFSGYTLLASGTPFTTDANKATWQEFGYTNIAVPALTRYIAFGLNSPTNAAQTYADAASMVLNNVTVVPEPSTWALWAAGLAAVGSLARRRR